MRRTAERVIREFRPDAILACWSHPDGWAAVVKSKALSVGPGLALTNSSLTSKKRAAGMLTDPVSMLPTAVPTAGSLKVAA